MTANSLNITMTMNYAPKVRVLAFTLLIMGSLLLGACLPNSQTPSRALSIGKALGSTEFDELGTWDAFQTDVANFGVLQGDYRAALYLPNHFLVADDNQLYTDTVIETTAFVLSDSPKSYYGIACRMDAQQHGYLFLVSVDGAYSIRVSRGNRLDDLVKWQDSQGVVKEGQNARNRLQAVCSGDYLAFYVNGIFLAEVTDTLYHDGNIGIVVGVGATGDIDLSFDHANVWATP